MAGGFKTRTATEADARGFIGKARQLLLSAQANRDARRWDAASVDSVHAVISANDAVLALRSGLKCAEEDHRRAADLLIAELGSPAKEASSHLRFVVGRKHVVEYEGRRITEKEALEVLQQAERFVKWAEKQLPGL